MVWECDFMKLVIKMEKYGTSEKVSENLESFALYEEITETFESYLGDPVQKDLEDFKQKGFTYRNELTKHDMVRLTLTYDVPTEKLKHTEKLVELLEILDVEIDMELVD